MPGSIRRTAIALCAAVLGTAGLLGPVTAAPAATKARAALSLTAPSSAPYGGRLQLTGTLWRYGTGTKIPGARVYLQRAAVGGTNWGSVSSTVTTADGSYRLSVPHGRQYDYRTVWGGNAGYAPAASPVRRPKVGQVISWQVLASSTWDGYVKASGIRYPAAPAGGPIYLQRYDPKTNAFTPIAFARTRSDGRFSLAARVGGSTGYYRLHTPAYGGLTGAYAPARRLVHHAPRGLFRKPLLGTGGTGHPIFEPAYHDWTYSLAVATADRGGSTWADLDYAGCRTLFHYYRSKADGSVRVELLAGSRVIESVTLGPGDEILQPSEPQVAGLSRVRLRVTDIDTTTGPFVSFDATAECSN